MKFFLSFLQSKHNHPIAAYSFWEYYIKNGIEESGHSWIECEEVDWAKGLVPQGKAEFKDWKSSSWEKTVSFLRNSNVNIFLSYLYPHQVDENAITELKKMGIYCVNFYCDHVRQFKKVPAEFAVFDLNWVPEHAAINWYKKANLPFLNLPMPMWVEPQFRTIPPFENNDVSFIGSKDIQRHLFFEQIAKIEPNLALNIYGSGWKDELANFSNADSSITEKLINQFSFLFKNGAKAYLNKIRSRNYHPSISTLLKNFIRDKPNFEDYIKISRESKTVIGINRYPSFNYPVNQPNTYSRLRDIEAPMLGACYLTEWAEGIDELYDIGTEIEVFTTNADFFEKLKVLDSDPVLRKKLRVSGQKRALHEHSIPNSIKLIVAYMNGKNKHN